MVLSKRPKMLPKKLYGIFKKFLFKRILCCLSAWPACLPSDKRTGKVATATGLELLHLG